MWRFYGEEAHGAVRAGKVKTLDWLGKPALERWWVHSDLKEEGRNELGEGCNTDGKATWSEETELKESQEGWNSLLKKGGV